MSLPMKLPMREIVINTGPVITLIAATISLDWLSKMYQNVWIPHEVDKEIAVSISGAPEQEALRHAVDVVRILSPLAFIPQALLRELDLGEASVIHTALEKKSPLSPLMKKQGGV